MERCEKKEMCKEHKKMPSNQIEYDEHSCCEAAISGAVCLGSCCILFNQFPLERPDMFVVGTLVAPVGAAFCAGVAAITVQLYQANKKAKEKKD